MAEQAQQTSTHARWVEEIKLYEQAASKWEEKARKVIRRYRDKRSAREEKSARYNILWSNVQTLRPALYSAKPKPDIERRFRDKDKMGRFSSMVLERAVSYFIDEKFDDVMKQAVLDRLLPGRGLIWVRYEPHFRDVEVQGNEEEQEEGAQLTDDADETEEEPLQEIEGEYVCFDYVHWEDFGHPVAARTWEELDAAWRRVYLDKEEIAERFGDEIAAQIQYDYSPKDERGQRIETVIDKATIYEIWDKKNGKVLWLNKNLPEFLDEKDDPLRLQDFWPFPKPLYATLANDDLIPVPDYGEYQDQAIELDQITSRISAIVRCLKVAGVYDASKEGIQRLLAEGVENQLIPIENWATFADKGGLDGSMQLLPMEEIAKTLLSLYDAREKVKNDLYEITGMADIVRGSTNAVETASAQQIKSQFATLRLSEMQEDVKRFARDLVKIGAEIIAEHFSLETLRSVSGVQLLTMQEKSFLQQRQQMAQQPQGQAMPPAQLPPLPPELAELDDEELAELMSNPTWEEIDALLKQETLLSYKVDIETDATLKFDQEADRDQRVQFLEAAGRFISLATQVEQPELAPLLGKMLMFGVRGFKIGKELESAFELTINKLEKAAENPQQKPNPEQEKVQGQLQIQQAQMEGDLQMEQARLEMEVRKIQAQAAADQQRMQLELEQKRQEHALELQADAQRSQIELQKHQVEVQAEADAKIRIAQMDNETKVIVAQIAAKAQLDAATLAANSQAYTANISQNSQGAAP